MLRITNNSINHHTFVYTLLKDQTVLFRIIQLRKSHLYAYSLSDSSVWPIDRTLSGSSTPSQSGPGKDGNEGVLWISKAPAFLEPHHQIVSCHIKEKFFLWGWRSYHSSEMLLVYFQPSHCWLGWCQSEETSIIILKTKHPVHSFVFW